MLGGAFMRMSIAGRTLDEEIFPIEFAVVDFVGGIILCTSEDLLGHAIRSGLKPYQCPEQVSLCWDRLFSMMPCTPHHAAKFP